MRSKLLILTLILIYNSSLAEQRGNLGRERLVDMLELPAYSNKKGNEKFVVKYRHSVSFNPKYRIPNWVAWKQTIQHYEPNYKRLDRFNYDVDVEGCPLYGDYTNNRKNVQRGHMCPHQVSSWDENARNSVDYMSNIAPQYYKINQNSGLWNKLEAKCKKWNNDTFTELYIVCGPILKNGSSDIYGYITFENGTKPIAIPKKFFKAILGKDKNGDYYAIAYIINNDDSLKGYYTTVDKVEELTGYDLFHNLPDYIENKIEAVVMEYKWTDCSFDGKCPRLW